MIKKIIFYTILLLLSFPIIDTIFDGIIPSDKLGGDYSKAQDVSFSTDSFFTGTYQQQKTSFLNENLNLYPDFVRIRNQYLFSAFGETKAVHTVVGKDNYMFDVSYISAYYGNDFIGEQAIKTKVAQIKYLKELLNYYDKNLIVCFLPGKASFYPEKIPDKYKQKEFHTTNIDYFTQELNKKGVTTLNLKQYFLNAKDTSQYSLYPKYGIHLSSYATVLTADTLIKFIEDTLNVDIPNPVITKMETTDSLKFYDADIYETLNLLLPLKMDTMAYPTIEYTQSKDKLKVLTIGDSFYKYIFDSGIHTNCFNNGSFWFYSKKVWPLSTNIEVKDLDIRKQIAETDLVILYATEATLYSFPYGASSIINEKILPLDEVWIKKYYTEMLNSNTDWQKSISEKAKANNLDYDIQKQRDIDYMVNEYINNLDDDSKNLIEIIKRIRNNDEWLQVIKQKAINNNTNLDNMIYLDAMYILNQEKK